MKKEDFIDKINQFGINLDDIKLAITPDKFLPGYICCSNGVLKSGRYLVFKVRDDGEYDILYHGKEDIIWDKFYNLVFTQLKEYGYINNKITRKIIEVNNTKVIDYLMNTYGLSEKRAVQSLAKLKTNFRVFNEFKYYMINSYFIASEMAVSIEGYTAQRLFETSKMKLNVLGSYNYLLYLETEPKEALKDLGHGLENKDTKSFKNIFRLK